MFIQLSHSYFEVKPDFKMSSYLTVVLCAALFFATTAVSGSLRNTKNDDLKSSSSFSEIPGSWVSDLFYRALTNFTVRNVGTTNCRKQVEMYETNLRNHTSWAVRSKYSAYTYH